MPNREIVERVSNAKRYGDGTILIENVRCSYPHLFVPQEGDKPGDKSYSMTALLPKKTHKAAQELITKACRELLEENKAKFKKGERVALAADRKFLRDGDLSGKTENEAMFTISAREKKRPSVRNKDKSVIDSSESDIIYGGCYVNVLIRPWFQDNDYGKRLNANLIAVQFVRDGEPFGEGRISEEDIDDTFDDIDDGDDGDAGFDDGDDDFGDL